MCKSSIVLCSDQKLKSACHLMKLAYVIDNPATIVYVILSSFWGEVLVLLESFLRVLSRCYILEFMAKKTIHATFKVEFDGRQS